MNIRNQRIISKNTSYVWTSKFVPSFIMISFSLLQCCRNIWKSKGFSFTSSPSQILTSCLSFTKFWRQNTRRAESQELSKMKRYLQRDVWWRHKCWRRWSKRLSLFQSHGSLTIRIGAIIFGVGTFVYLLLQVRHLFRKGLGGLIS